MEWRKRSLSFGTKIEKTFPYPLPSKKPAKELTQFRSFEPNPILKLKIIIPITANALATFVPIILFFIKLDTTVNMDNQLPVKWLLFLNES